MSGPEVKRFQRVDICEYTTLCPVFLTLLKSTNNKDDNRQLQ